MEVPPTIVPNPRPNVQPERKTVTEINSTFGISIKIKPNAIAVEVNIAAFTRLLRFIFF